jgi:hypothetical protein
MSANYHMRAVEGLHVEKSPQNLIQIKFRHDHRLHHEGGGSY